MGAKLNAIVTASEWTRDYSLVLDALLDRDWVLLEVRQSGRVLQVHDEMLARRKSGRSKLQGKDSDLATDLFSTRTPPDTPPYAPWAPRLRRLHQGRYRGWPSSGPATRPPRQASRTHRRSSRRWACSLQATNGIVSALSDNVSGSPRLPGVLEGAKSSSSCYGRGRMSVGAQNGWLLGRLTGADISGYGDGR